ncbi:147_t:CDS:2, partial [Ambispora gerdemannii]
DKIQAEYTPDMQEWISEKLFDTRINGFNATIKRYAIRSSFFVMLYVVITFLC